MNFISGYDLLAAFLSNCSSTILYNREQTFFTECPLSSLSGVFIQILSMLSWTTIVYMQ